MESRRESDSGSGKNERGRGSAEGKRELGAEEEMKELDEMYLSEARKIEECEKYKMLAKITKVEFIPSSFLHLSNGYESLKSIQTITSILPKINICIANETCSICMCQFVEETSRKSTPLKDSHGNTLRELSNLDDNEIDSTAVKLENCVDHFFHLSCLHSLLLSGSENHIKCPVCQQIYGKKTGDQPDGSMTVDYQADLHCSGYPKVGTLVIQYHFPNGVRRGVAFRGTHRVAYIPATEEGKVVCSLLMVALI